MSGQEAAPAAATLAEVVISVLMLPGRNCHACVESHPDQSRAVGFDLKVPFVLM